MSSVPRRGSIYGLYCTCHRERGIRYVGQTVLRPSRRLRSHITQASRDLASGKQLVPSQRWVLKHGGENIRQILLESGVEGEDLDLKEQKWIGKFEDLLNIRPGGDSVSGWKHRPETIAKMRVSASLWKRGPVSEARRAAVSLQMKGVPLTSEHRARISAAKMGKPATEEARRNMSLAQIRSGNSRGEANPRSVLTESEVLEIRALYAEFAGRKSHFYRDASASYGVSYNSIYSLCSGKTWAHLE